MRRPISFLKDNVLPLYGGAKLVRVFRIGCRASRTWMSTDLHFHTINHRFCAPVKFKKKASFERGLCFTGTFRYQCMTMEMTLTFNIVHEEVSEIFT